MTAEPTNPLNVFYSYARKDEKLRSELGKHLTPLKRQNLIKDWYDRDISAGKEWEQEIAMHLNTSQIILLLISPDFLASDYCYGIEMKRALERHEAGEARIIPIMLRPVDWQGTPFRKLQTLPKNAKAVTSWSSKENAFVEVAKGIREAVKELKAQPSLTLAPPTTAIEEVIINSSINPSSLPVITQEHQSSIPVLAPVWHVPYRRNPFFTGREDILTRIHTILTAEKTAAVSQPPAISGLGGIGKTQTAVEYAYRYRDDYQAVLWVQANTHEILISGFVALAGHLNLPEKNAQDQSQAVHAVKRWLEQHSEWLLIFDNADDLSVVDTFLPSALAGSNGHILFTTRTHTMSGRAQRIEVKEMPVDEGALFLLRRTDLLAPDTPFSSIAEAVRTAATAIVEAVDGLPLALDQAGAYIEETGCSLSHYLELYQTRRKELHLRRSKQPEGHPEPVATTWSLSFQKIEQASPVAADLLRFCAFLHPDAIPEEIITEGAQFLSPVLQSVANDLIKLDEAIGELLNYSLVRRHTEGKSLFVHRLVQAVLRDEMDPATQQQWAELTVQTISDLFPFGVATTWHLCERYLPHAILCVTYIKQWSIFSVEAAYLLHNTASYLDDRARYGEAEPLYQRALAISERLQGPDHPNTASNLNNLAVLYMNHGKYEQAEPLLQRAVAIRERVLGRDHPDTAQSFDNLATLYYQWKFEQAEPFYQRALAIRERVLGPDHPDTAQSLDNLATLYSHQGKFEQAEPLHQRALAIRERVLGPDHPDTARSLNNLAVLYSNQGKFEQAKSLLQRALSNRERVLGPDHPDTAQSLDNLASIYKEQGKYKQAESLHQRALAINERVLGPDHPNTARKLSNLASLYVRQGKYEQAESLCRRALAIYERMLGPDHPNTAIGLNNLALFYADRGEYEQAELLLQRALAIYERVLEPDHPVSARSLDSLALLYAKQGKYEQAEPFFQRALAIRERVLKPDHPDTASSLDSLALLYAKQGKYEQAEPLYQRALAIRERKLGAEHPDTKRVQENYADLLQKMN